MLQKIKSISVLVAICAVMALLLAVTNQITAPIIEQNKAAQNSGALQQIIEGGVFEMVDLTGKDIPDGVTEIKDATFYKCTSSN
jgi:Na+-translocating ferredoxin:NAD+ oxidoreductase RnfG subunit